MKPKKGTKIGFFDALLKVITNTASYSQGVAAAAAVAETNRLIKENDYIINSPNREFWKFYYKSCFKQ